MQFSIVVILLVLISITPVAAFADQKMILVEEHVFGNITRYYEPDAEFPREFIEDCIAPPRIENTVTPVKGFSFRIILPDNDYCWMTGVILSEANYTALQNNVAVFTVKDRTAVTAIPTHNYCQFAYWIWNGQTADYQKRLENLTKYVFPEYCYKEIPNAVVPEFGIIAMSILATGITGIIIMQRKVL